jgi:NAD+ synthase (glutamine-hydrolysing)
LKDYVIKNGFEKVVLGLSGGIDSALVATIAADVLGKENVKAVFMPSQYTSRQSRDDSIELVKNIGIEFTEMPITDIFSAYLKDLGPHFEGQAPNIAEENLQARIRGNLLMAFSNKFGYLVLATGNKSEVSTGYATLYGDMCGGLSVIKDVPKTMVYKLANYRNSISSVIPQSIIDRPPTAELKPEQKDQDTLPTYDVLDKIIEYYVENDMSTEEIVRASRDLPSSLVEKTISMIDRNEYKRRQSAPGIKITPKAFGKDRRLPITNKYSV